MKNEQQITKNRQGRLFDDFDKKLRDMIVILKDIQRKKRKKS